MRKHILLLTLVGALVSAPRMAEAQGTDLESSMQAFCATLSCSEVVFTLDIEGDYFLNAITLNTDNPNWQFGGLLGVMAGGFDLTAFWAPTGPGTQSGLSLQAQAFPASPNPISFRVQMTAPSGANASDLRISYDGSAFETPIPFPPSYSVGGTVTPEPSTYALLGTGLLGLALAARRRRKNEELAQD